MGDLVSPAVDLGDAYEPQDAIGRSMKSATMTGAAGLFMAAVQNTVLKQNVGAMGVFTRFGSTIALFAGMGGTYAFISTASANLRQKKDPYNDALGGFFAGSLIGLRRRSMPSTIGSGLALGVALAAMQYSGGNIFRSSDADEDTYLTKEEIRKRHRRPVNELINEIGEGRGIYGAGYEERRKQRIKDNYGIDVPEPYYKTSS